MKLNEKSETTANIFFKADFSKKDKKKDGMKKKRAKALDKINYSSKN